MNWEATGALGDLVGGIGVIATLGYLAFQIRQNTRQLAQNELAAKTAVLNASTTALRENRNFIIESAQLTEIWLKGLDSPDKLDDAEGYRCRLLLHNLTDALSQIYAETVETGFSPQTWETQAIGIVERVFTTPGGRMFWNSYRQDYTPQFANVVDQLLELRLQSDQS
jgi:hypothetical protein